jgi:hypothetical protein
LFDHAKHNGINYIKGRCFVALTSSFPIIVEASVRCFISP